MRLFALLIISVSFAVRAEAQVTLQFKLAEGDVIRQVMTQEMTSASNVQGRDISTEMKQLMHIEQRIGEVGRERVSPGAARDHPDADVDEDAVRTVLRLRLGS